VGKKHPPVVYSRQGIVLGKIRETLFDFFGFGDVKDDAVQNEGLAFFVTFDDGSAVIVPDIMPFFVANAVLDL
jgi:hypothetical protein